MVQVGLFDETQMDMLRKCVVFYAAISSEVTPLDFGFQKMDSLKFHDIRTRLMPLLRKKERFDLESSKDRVREHLAALLSLTENDRQFLSAFADGKYHPELLFNGDELARVANHPMAMWKMQKRE